MHHSLRPWQILLTALAGWINGFLPSGSGNTRFYETARPEKSVPDYLGGK